MATTSINYFRYENIINYYVENKNYNSMKNQVYFNINEKKKVISFISYNGFKTSTVGDLRVK